MAIRLSQLTLAAVPLALGIACAEARLAPALSIKGLADSSDLIIAGKVESVREIGSGSIELNGVGHKRLDFQADIRVDETIKGASVPHKFTFSYSTPAADGMGNVAEGRLAPNAYRVVFLKKATAGFAFVSPYYPSIPAASKSCGPDWQVNLGEDAYRKVLQRLLSLLCTDSTSDEKRSALFALNWGEDSASLPFLKAALSLPNVRSDPTLRMLVISDLLHWRDLSVLPLVEQDLSDQSVQSSSFPKSNLVLAASSLEPAVSVPILARVLKSPQADERVAAARFLEYTNSEAALGVLLSALDDPNREVQFAVMQSLGNLRKQHQWRPNTIDPDSHWNECIHHWHDFETRRGRSKTVDPD